MSPTTPRVALDAAGGDFAPDATVAGAIEARERHGIVALLVGDDDAISARLRAFDQRPDAWRIEHAPDVIAMGEHAVAAIRSRRQSSIRRAAELLKAGEVDAVVTMGNTGAATAAGVLIVGRAAGVRRPGLAALLPAAGSPPLVIDVGANATAKPAQLVQFGWMGQVYQQRVRELAEPRVGLLSIGAEASKGNPLVLEAAEGLAASGMRFVGHVEPADIFQSAADVVVCDGFSGNILIKAMEATAEFAFDTLRDEVRRRGVAKLGALLMRPAFRALRRRTDYAQWGGVPLLGLDGVMIIGHGRSNARAVSSALRVADQAVRARLVETIADGVAEVAA